MSTRWSFTHLKQQFFTSKGNVQDALEQIRAEMLASLGQVAAKTFPVVELRVTHANELQDLWYLRGDLMAAIAAIDGELVAREKLTQISDMFKGYLPKGLSTRPSPLAMG